MLGLKYFQGVYKIMIRNNLAKLMIDRKISATQLFNDTGIARSTISKISNNSTDKISLNTIDKLCNYLEVTPHEFFEIWPYEVSVSCGFLNFDNLQEVKETNVIKFFEEPAFISIELKRGRTQKIFFEYELTIICEYNPNDVFNEMKIKEDEIKLSKNCQDTKLLDEMPIQFKKDLIKDIDSQLISTFELLPFLEISSHLEEKIFYQSN